LRRCLSAQDAPPTVQVTGAVKQELTLSADDLAKMPRATVKTTSNGMETVYEGVWLHEVLKKAGVPQGGELRGKALASYVLAQRRTAIRWCSRWANWTRRLSTTKSFARGYRERQAPVWLAGPVPAGGSEGQTRRAFSVRMLTKLEVVQVRK
jgi:DMSO/TMAO reductase YedYZ molybdopterin-dependent catalytic subunit